VGRTALTSARAPVWIATILVTLATIAVMGLLIASARAAGVPAVEREFATGVGVSTARLAADIDTSELETTYRFEYGTGPTYGMNAPASNAPVGSVSSTVSVSVPLAGLDAGTTYHYRVSATNSEGTIAGPDQVFHTFPATTGEGDTCANTLIRDVQFSTYLPECRAYEMVSPLDKNGGNIAAQMSMTQSSTSGDAVKYFSTAAFGGSPAIETAGSEYVAERSEAGWLTHAINPNQGSTSLIAAIGGGSQYQYLSPDLSKAVYFALTPLTSGHPSVEGVANLYLRSDVLAESAGAYTLLTDCPGCGETPLPARPFYEQGLLTAFVGVSSDMRHIFFESVYDLTSDAQGTSVGMPKLYEWDEGTVRLAGVLPNGEPASVSVAGSGAGGDSALGDGGWTEDSVSSDGSRVVFTVPSEGSQVPFQGSLYMRVDGAETIQLNVNERAEADSPYPARYEGVAADGSKVFFSSPQLLTNDATPAHENLYMYDLNAPAGKHLTLISVDDEPNGFEVGARILLVGTSTDGSYVYFQDAGALVAGQPPIATGSEGGALYVWHAGVVRYVSSHNIVGQEESGVQWGGYMRHGGINARVSDSGNEIVFANRDRSTAEAVAYDNLTAVPGECPTDTVNGEAHSEDRCSELYVYDYGTNKLTCASCDPSGAAPIGNAGFLNVENVDAAFNVPFSTYQHVQYQNRPLSEDGRYVFFDTVDPLVSRDTNGRRDVYEFDTARAEVHLITSGTCACDAQFVDASPDGANAFFTTPQSLVRVDVDKNSDLYDARVLGGISDQNVAPQASCEGEDCQGPAKAPSVFSLPSSSTFVGAGNAVPEMTISGPVRTRVLSRAQKLAKALRLCHRKRGRRARHRCEVRARSEFGAAPAKRASGRVGR
jgi:hypothetical protein